MDNVFIFLGFVISLCSIVLLLCISPIQWLRKKRQPKKLFIWTVAISSISIATFFYSIYFYSFSSVDRDKLQQDGKPIRSEQYEATVLYEPYGGAVGGVNVWVEVRNLQTNEVKMIYSAPALQSVQLNWQDATHLSIDNERGKPYERNLSVILNVQDDIYDENGVACKSFAMRESYKTCYSE